VVPGRWTGQTTDYPLIIGAAAVRIAMPTDIPGIHHVTAIAGDPGRNLTFYTETLGLRLVKRSVNQDDVSVYHLFYGDRQGSPGTSMTFFPYGDARPGRVGTGQVETTQFLVPAESIDFWVERLDAAGVTVEEPVDRAGERVLPFADPDGLSLELVGVADPPAGDPPDGTVASEHAIRGFYGVTLRVGDPRGTASLLEAMGFEEAEEDGTGSAPPDGSRRRFVADGELASVVDLTVDPDGERGLPGAGTVHHVAFQVTAEEQEAWRQLLIDRGLRPTEIIDRKWFESVYVRTPGGVLFEFATKSPGYTVDEDLEDLGESLMLPGWLEDRREDIESSLPELDVRIGAE